MIHPERAGSSAALFIIIALSCPHRGASLSSFCHRTVVHSASRGLGHPLVAVKGGQEAPVVVVGRTFKVVLVTIRCNI